MGDGKEAEGAGLSLICGERGPNALRPGGDVFLFRLFRPFLDPPTSAALLHDARPRQNA